MPGLIATHCRIGGPILHQRPQRRAVAFRAALVMTVSSTAGVFPANGAGHAASGTARPVLKFPRRDTGEKTFKTVLSVDGGGLRGLVPAGMLEGVEDMIKQVATENQLVGEDEHGNSVQVTEDTPFSVLLADYFDVVAGTSTGSIVATYVASKGRRATPLHTSDSFQPAVTKTRDIKANVSGPGVPSTAGADIVDMPPDGSAAAVQALFLSTCEEIFPWRTIFTNITQFIRPKYPADYRVRAPWLPFAGKKMGIERVLQSAFGGNDVHMSTPNVLASSLVVSSYQLDYDRPFIFYCSTKDVPKEGPKAAKSGYASLRRTLAGANEVVKIDPHDTAAQARLKAAGQSDLVRLPQEFRLWEVVRASTAAPTFFATAAVNILDPDNPNKLAKKDGKPRAPMKMTDGGVVANNPSMLGLNFAAGEYETQFVADEEGKPSLAILSMGCGTTSQLSDVKPRAGIFGWAATGPIFEILQGGQGELSAAIFQELSREWPGSGKYQSLRLQLTAGLDQAGNETLSYSEDVVTLPKDHTKSTKDPMVGCFQRALEREKGDPLRANDVLKTMDVVGQADQLLGLGYAVVADPCVQDKLQTFVVNYVLAGCELDSHYTAPASKAASHGAATVAAGA